MHKFGDVKERFAAKVLEIARGASRKLCDLRAALSLKWLKMVISPFLLIQAYNGLI